MKGSFLASVIASVLIFGMTAFSAQAGVVMEPSFTSTYPVKASKETDCIELTQTSAVSKDSAIVLSTPLGGGDGDKYEIVTSSKTAYEVSVVALGSDPTDAGGNSNLGAGWRS